MAIELPHFAELPTNKSNNQTWLAGIPCIAPYKKSGSFSCCTYHGDFQPHIGNGVSLTVAREISMIAG